MHLRGARIYLDIPINHTGWASWLQTHHPQWFVRSHDHTFQSPGVWGVTWEDLSELDYSHRDLWRYMADVFLYWCEQGVDGFRCDAGYMVPGEVWAYIAAKVRRVFPDTVFLLEGLGGPPETMNHLLLDGGLDWAYSELFQTETREQLQGYLPHAAGLSASHGTMVHFAETHDNLRMAARSPVFARMRTALAALCSEAGAFGITNGVEWFADQKVDVHGAPPLRWGHACNQVEAIARLNALLASHPAFESGTRMQGIHGGDTEEALALLRMDRDDRPSLLVLVNLVDERHSRVTWRQDQFALDDDVQDLLTGDPFGATMVAGAYARQLEPGQVLCLGRTTADGGTVLDPLGARARNEQRAEAWVAALWSTSSGCRTGFSAASLPSGKHGGEPLSGPVVESEARPTPDIGQAAKALLRDPRAFPVVAGGEGAYQPVVHWQWPADRQRCVMIPPGHYLLVTCPHPFDVFVREDERAVQYDRSLQSEDGSHFALMSPRRVPRVATPALLVLRLYEGDLCRRVESPLRYLPRESAVRLPRAATRDEVVRGQLFALCTNGRGAMAPVAGAWGTLYSQYDALLAANLHSDYPVDRHIMLTRCRAWIVYRDYSQALNLSCLEQFGLDGQNRAVWQMSVPCGMGQTVPLTIELELAWGRNSVTVSFQRGRGTDRGTLADEAPVELILRPDLEDRNFHTVTKAMTGPETSFPAGITGHDGGFTFAPGGDRSLVLNVEGATFVSEPEWAYMIPHPVEKDRGLAGQSDLFSPGFFSVRLRGGDERKLSATARVDGADPADVATDLPVDAPRTRADGLAMTLLDAAREAIPPFVVKRDASLTVIAGYPWFLDWGRDTLICLRGMLAAGMVTETREILVQFARFEKGGTLPNMIRGNDDSNRDTSDAPLWFVVGCRDLCRLDGSVSFLDTDCGGRSILSVLLSIARGYRSGTPNGIRMDDESGLIFSPSHFTWMDTNHPAGTPREGYPVEIQALWYAGLSFLAECDSGGDWGALAAKVRASTIQRFARVDGLGFADCLHTTGFHPAADAAADDAVRSNQLKAITLGLVDDPALCRSIVSACECLLIPGAIRSLADREVTYPLEVHSGVHRLNDPLHPYWGHYRGDEDTRRKPAYHNGTAWTWPFPSYSEALYMTYGETAREAALAILGSSAELVAHGCVGQLPEILDGSTPHAQRGCGAQAWGATELYRVLELLKR